MKRYICMILLISLLIGAAGCQQTGSDQKTTLCFTSSVRNQNEGPIFSEEYDMSSKEKTPPEVLQMLFKQEAPSGYDNLWKGCELNSCLLTTNKTLIVDLSDYYNELSGINLTLADVALVQTIYANFPEEIQGVQILCNGLSPAGREDIIYYKESLQFETMDLQSVDQDITIWFAESDKRFLLPETRSVILRENENTDDYILDELMKGSQESGRTNLFKEFGDFIQGVSRDDTICFVSLDSDAEEVFQSTFQNEALTLFAIVQSLTSQEDVSLVQFLVDGNKQDYYGDIPISEPIAGDEQLETSYDSASGQEIVTFYYTGPDGETVIPVQRVISYQAGTSVEEKTLQEFFEIQPPFWSKCQIPADVSVNSFQIQGGICFIQLSPEFIVQHNPSRVAETMLIESMVATLTGFNAIDSVQISVEGQIKPSFQFYSFETPITGENIPVLSD